MMIIASVIIQLFLQNTTVMMKVLFFLLLVLSSTNGFQAYHESNRHHQPITLPQSSNTGFVKQFLNHVVAIGFISGFALTNSPQASVAVSDEITGPLENAIIQASDATYPVLESLTLDTVSPLSKKITKLLTTKVPTEKLTKALVDGTDTLLSVPDDNINKFVSTVKSSYQDINIDTCTKLPIPEESFSLLTESEAFSNIQTEKIQQVNDRIINPIVKSIPSEKGAICLPSKQGLSEVWLGQTKLVLAIPTPMKQKFGADLVPVVSSIPNSDLLRILPDAKKILSGVDRKQAFKFQESSKNLDKALKQDYRFKSLQAF